MIYPMCRHRYSTLNPTSTDICEWGGSGHGSPAAEDEGLIEATVIVKDSLNFPSPSLKKIGFPINLYHLMLNIFDKDFNVYFISYDF